MGQSLKPIIFDALKLEFTMSREITELANRIAFFDPKFKPMLLIALFDMRLLPDKRFRTRIAAKTLFLLSRFSVAFDL